MEKTITKDLLKSELFSGGKPAAEILYTRYSGMLYSYILQFVPDQTEAGTLLVEIYSRLTPQLEEAFESSLSVYCWLQVESRKIILEYLQKKGQGIGEAFVPAGFSGGSTRAYYFTLLEDAPPEHQWVFRELFLYGRSKEELALRSGKDLAYVSKLLRECLGMIRKNLE
ncbi:MAG TPA: hypothetical protein VGM89_16230 [Puia sp.]